MELVEQWMNDKNKTYWNCWQCLNGDYTEGTWSWVLFWTADEVDTTYESGLAGSEIECKLCIKEEIIRRLKKEGLL